MIILLKKEFIIFSLIAIYCTFGVINFFDEEVYAVATMGTNTNKCYVAIVIDDFGYNGEGSEDMLSLDIDLTAAIMPFSSHSKETVEQVYNANKEMIIHMPMESLTGDPSWVGDKAVKTSLSDEEIKELTNEAIEIVKYAKGLNNHMGSKIMEDKTSLTSVVEVLEENNMFFLDSKTTQNSVAEEVCGEHEVVVVNRDVFLDSTDSVEVVIEKLKQTEKIAIENGFALAIGHVGPDGGNVTVEAIKNTYPEMEKNGVEFVTLSEYVELKKLNNTN